MERKECIDRIRRTIASMANTLEALKELPDIEGIEHWGTVENAILARMPYNLVTLSSVLSQLNDYGYTEQSRYLDNRDGSLCITLTNLDFQRISLWLEPQREGSTCKVKKVGEKITPIFEIVEAQE